MVICGKCLRRPVYSKCFISIQKSQHDAAWSILPFRFVHSHRSHAPESCPVFYAEPDPSARDASNPESPTSGPTLGWVYHPSHPSNWQRKMRTGPLVGSGKTESRVRCWGMLWPPCKTNVHVSSWPASVGASQDCASENCNHALHRVWTSVNHVKIFHVVLTEEWKLTLVHSPPPLRQVGVPCISIELIVGGRQEAGGKKAMIGTNSQDSVAAVDLLQHWNQRIIPSNISV